MQFPKQKTCNADFINISPGTKQIICKGNLLQLCDRQQVNAFRPSVSRVKKVTGRRNFIISSHEHCSTLNKCGNQKP